MSFDLYNYQKRLLSKDEYVTVREITNGLSDFCIKIRPEIKEVVDFLEAYVRLAFQVGNKKLDIDYMISEIVTKKTDIGMIDEESPIALKLKERNDIKKLSYPEKIIFIDNFIQLRHQTLSDKSEVSAHSQRICEMTVVIQLLVLNFLSGKIYHTKDYFGFVRSKKIEGFPIWYYDWVTS